MAAYAGISPQVSKYTGMVCNVPENDNLNVRQAPDNNAPNLSAWGLLSNGNLVEVLEERNDGWDKIRIAGQYVGYAYGKYITNVSEIKYDAEVCNVPAGDVLNVRVNPWDDADLLPEWPGLSNTNRVGVLGEVGNGWTRIRIAGQYDGFVYGEKYLKRV